MPRKTKQLTALSIKSLTVKGFYPDGENLYLQVSQTGTKSWVFMYELHGKRHKMGLGSYPTVTLKDARDASLKARQLLQQGIDPLSHKRKVIQANKLEATKTITFDECTALFIESKKAEWRNPKHHQQWKNTLQTYASPIFGSMSVADIDQDLILKVIDPIWRTKNPTATRVRGRIESVLDWAIFHGYREGENPARLKGHLDKVLPSAKKITKDNHFSALPFKQMSAFMEKLRLQDGISARAFEFCILTATRTSETLKAQWIEIDLENRTWLIPPERMKAHVAHKVPLTGRCIEILALMRLNPGPYVFTGRKDGSHLSNTAFLQTLKRMNYKKDVTAHGFRSSFRDWCAETMDGYEYVAEMALAHTIKSDVERAYRRGDLFEKRLQLMNEWAKFCGYN